MIVRWIFSPLLQKNNEKEGPCPFVRWLAQIQQMKGRRNRKRRHQLKIKRKWYRHRNQRAALVTFLARKKVISRPNLFFEFPWGGCNFFFFMYPVHVNIQQSAPIGLREGYFNASKWGFFFWPVSFRPCSSRTSFYRYFSSGRSFRETFVNTNKTVPVLLFLLRPEDNEHRQGKNNLIQYKVFYLQVIVRAGHWNCRL